MLPALCTALAGLLLLLPLLLRRAWPYFLRDLRFALTVARAAGRARAAAARRPPATLLDVFAQRARRTPHKPLLLFGDEVLTYEQVERRSSRAARALRDAAGLRAGGCLALLAGNRPAYLWVWLGCAKLGCAMACLNSSIRAASLLRCFQSSAATVLLAAPGERAPAPAGAERRGAERSGAAAVVLGCPAPRRGSWPRPSVRRGGGRQRRSCRRVLRREGRVLLIPGL